MALRANILPLPWTQFHTGHDLEHEFRYDGIVLRGLHGVSVFCEAGVSLLTDTATGYRNGNE